MDKNNKYSKYITAPVRAAVKILYRRIIDVERNRFVFILCPMRSGSSMLMHVLCSNPEVCGYGETHITYSSYASFEELVWHNYWALRRLPRNGKYIADKMAHSRYLPDPAILGRVDAHYIFLTRNAESSISSIMNNMYIDDLQRSLAYWRNRVEDLVTTAEALKNRKRSVYIEYEAIVNDPVSTLSQLGEILGLRDRLTDTYTLNRYSGRRVVGDASPRIMTGKVLADTSRATKNAMDAEKIEQAQTLLNMCRTRVRLACEHIIE